MMSRIVRQICLLGVAGALLVSTTAVAHAQSVDGDADDSQAPTAAELRQKVEHLKQRLKQEREAASDATKRREQALKQARDKRDALANDLLELEAKRQTLTQRRDALGKELEQRRAQADALRSQITATRRAAGELTERLGIYLRQLPGHADLATRMNTWRDRLARSKNDASTAATQPAHADAVANLLRAVDRLHAQATRVSVREVELWTARQRRETVALLSAGHQWFAYHVPNTDRVGVALGAPADVQGYRWTEQVTGQTAQQIRGAIAQANADEAGITLLPTDVTDRLKVEALTRQQTLADTLREGGAIMLPLAVVTVLALILILERVWILYVRNGRSSRAASRVLAACRRGEFDQAASIATSARGTVSRTLIACLRRRDQGQHAMEDSIQEQLMHETPRLSRFLGGIAVLASVAPLLGLLGTVTGIIDTFGVIRSFGNAEPGLMAGGISEALVTTASGLVIAIPVLLIHSVLRGRVDRIIADAEKQSATLLNLLSHDDASRSVTQNTNASSTAPALNTAAPTKEEGAP